MHGFKIHRPGTSYFTCWETFSVLQALVCWEMLENCPYLPSGRTALWFIRELCFSHRKKCHHSSSGDYHCYKSYSEASPFLPPFPEGSMVQLLMCTLHPPSQSSSPTGKWAPHRYSLILRSLHLLFPELQGGKNRGESSSGTYLVCGKSPLWSTDERPLSLRCHYDDESFPHL